MKEIIIDSNFSDMRIDRFILKTTSLSKVDIQKLLRKKYIKLNGAKAEGNIHIKEGDKVTFYLKDDIFNKNDIKIDKVNTDKLDVLFENENIIILDKPSGVLSQGNGSNKEDLISMLKSYCNSNEVGIITRLDFNTSGIVICGKNRKSLMLLNEMARNNLINKTYYTLVKGKFDISGKINHYGFKDVKNNKLILQNEYKKNYFLVSSVFTPISYYDGYTLVSVKLITGKTHQIRSQLEKLGFSVVGDMKYNKHNLGMELEKNTKLNRQFLHCKKIEIDFKGKYEALHTGKLEVDSKIPEDLNFVIKYLKK